VRNHDSIWAVRCGPSTARETSASQAPKSPLSCEASTAATSRELTPAIHQLRLRNRRCVHVPCGLLPLSDASESRYPRVRCPKERKDGIGLGHVSQVGRFSVCCCLPGACDGGASASSSCGSSCVSSDSSDSSGSSSGVIVTSVQRQGSSCGEERGPDASARPARIPCVALPRTYNFARVALTRWRRLKLPTSGKVRQGSAATGIERYSNGRA